MQKIKSHYIPALICSAISLVFYIKTLMPGIGGWGDSARFQFFGRTLGTSYPTGYPLYILINNVFSRLPVGTLAYRINLLSAVLAAATVFVLFLIIAKFTRKYTAAVTALFFGFSRVFWSQAVIAEVYTLNSFLIAVIVLLVLEWQENRNTNLLFLAAYISGLSMCNHLTTVLLAPAIILFVALKDYRVLGARNIRLALGLLAIGLSLYLYLFVRSFTPSNYLEMKVKTIGEFINMLSGGHFRNQMFAFTTGQLISERLPGYIVTLTSQFGFAGYIAGLSGICLLLRDRMKHGIFLVLLTGSFLFYSLNYNIPDIAVYYIPTFMLFAVFIGYGLQRIIDYFGKKLSFILKAALPLFLVLTLVSNYPAIDQSNNVCMDGFTDAVLSSVETNSVIITPGFNWTQYYLYKLLGEKKRREDNIFLLWCWAERDSLTPYLRDALLKGKEYSSLDLPPAGETGGYPYVPGPAKLAGMNIYFHSENLPPLEAAGIPHAKSISLACMGIEDSLYKVTRGDEEVSVKTVTIKPEIMNAPRIARDSVNISFGYTDRHYLENGWSWVEYDDRGTPFCWADAKTSSISVFLKKGGYAMDFRAMPFEHNDAVQVIKVFFNGSLRAETNLDYGMNTYSLDIPEKLVVEGKNHILFEFSYAESPYYSIGSPDKRKLAAAFEWIKLRKI